MADDRGGTGMVYAALSREPLDLARFASGMHWDYNKLRLEGEDAEAELTWLVRQASSNGRFEYDLLGYRVYGPGFEEAQPVIVAGGGGWYDPYTDCLACGWRTPGTSIRIGLGVGGGGWYDPWFDPWYDPWYPRTWRSGWGYGGWGGNWGGWDPYWGRPGRPIVVYPTYPRPTIPNTVYGVRSRPNLPVPTTTRGRVTSAPNSPPRTGTGSGGTSAPVRPRAPQTEPTRARPAVERTPSQGNTPPAGRPTERTAPPPSSRPTTPPAQNEGRSRRPNDEITTPFAPAEPRVVTPAVNRRGEDRAVTLPERPVYRPPTPVRTPRTERRVEPSRGTDERPVTSPPRQAERSAPQRTRTVERPPAPAPRQVERPSAPAARSAPPAARPSPPPSRPASPPPSSSSGRSRSRPAGNN
jgi:hypothetical protein